MSDWPRIEADLRRALLRAGHSAAAVNEMLAALQPAFAAIERARGKVEDELVWALVGVAADRARRHAQQGREPSHRSRLRLKSAGSVRAR